MNKFSFASSPAWSIGEKFPGGNNKINKERERMVMEQGKYQDQELMILIRKIEIPMVGSNSFLILESEQETEVKVRLQMLQDQVRNPFLNQI